MRILFNKLSGRLKLTCSIFEPSLIRNFQNQRNSLRYIHRTPLFVKNVANLPLPLTSCTCSQQSSAFLSPYQRSVRWHSAQSKPTEISYEELLELIDDGGIIIDVRTEKEVNENGSVPQARNIPLEELKGALSRDPEDFEKVHGITKPNKKEDKLVFYATGPVKSSTALELAQKLGFKKARHYPGGWKEWSEKQTNPRKYENN